jgi:hypothetical protein
VHKKKQKKKKTAVICVCETTEKKYTCIGLLEQLTSNISQLLMAYLLGNWD